MQKHTKLVFAAAALALALAGCGASSSSTAPSASSAPASSAAASSEVAVSAPAVSSEAKEETNGTGTLDIDAAFDELLKANPISNQFEIAAMNMEYDFGLAADDVVAYKGVKSNDNGDAGLVLVIETAGGRAEAVKGALETYLEDQVVFYGNYAEFAQAQANVGDATVAYAEKDGSGLVLLVIASNECTDTDAIASVKENAIDLAMG